MRGEHRRSQRRNLPFTERCHTGAHPFIFPDDMRSAFPRRGIRIGQLALQQ